MRQKKSITRVWYTFKLNNLNTTNVPKTASQPWEWHGCESPGVINLGRWCWMWVSRHLPPPFFLAHLIGDRLIPQQRPFEFSRILHVGPKKRRPYKWVTGDITPISWVITLVISLIFSPGFSLIFCHVFCIGAKSQALRDHWPGESISIPIRWGIPTAAMSTDRFFGAIKSWWMIHIYIDIYIYRRNDTKVGELTDFCHAIDNTYI